MVVNTLKRDTIVSFVMGLFINRFMLGMQPLIIVSRNIMFNVEAVDWRWLVFITELNTGWQYRN